ARGMLQGGFDHDAFEGRYRAVQQAGLTACQCLVRPLAQGLFPVGDRCCVLRQAQQLWRQIADVHFTARGHDGDPAAGVFQLAYVARPRKVLE
nr:hypothetical protein [Tanacetum cinerariifolium]